MQLLLAEEVLVHLHLVPRVEQRVTHPLFQLYLPLVVVEVVDGVVQVVEQEMVALVVEAEWMLQVPQLY